MNLQEALEILKKDPNARLTIDGEAMRDVRGLHFDGALLLPNGRESAYNQDDGEVWEWEAGFGPKAETPADPKKIAGATKPDLSLIPGVALAHMAMAMESGALKYGPYNWRTSGGVEARTYVAAAIRHLQCWLDGEEFTSDSGTTSPPVHNLGAVMACGAILLDAQAQGALIDNRPAAGKTSQVLDELQTQKKAKQK